MSGHIIAIHKPPIGHIILNRPQALNALTLDMIESIHRVLDSFRGDHNILAVFIEGAGERAFCAGGDIRSIASARGDVDFGLRIFKAEYTLNYKIATYPKPYIAIMNGVTMGGGVGISVYGSHRIVADSTRFAMPECAIGLFPDIGASWFLNRAPGQTGMYHALTGTIMNAADALYTGMATHYLNPHNLSVFRDQIFHIQSTVDIDKILHSLSGQPDAPSLIVNDRNRIDDCFQWGDLWQTYRKLDQSDWGREVRAVMDKHSPTSLAITWEAMRRAKHHDDLKKTLETDLLLTQHCLRRDEFYEGVRAAVIDKDKNPRWNPSRLSDLMEDHGQDHFLPLHGLDLSLF